MTPCRSLAATLLAATLLVQPLAAAEPASCKKVRMPDIGWTDIQLSALWSLIYGVVTIALAYWWFRRKDILS